MFRPCSAKAVPPVGALAAEGVWLLVPVCGSPVSEGGFIWLGKRYVVALMHEFLGQSHADAAQDLITLGQGELVIFAGGLANDFRGAICVPVVEFEDGGDELLVEDSGLFTDLCRDMF